MDARDLLDEVGLALDVGVAPRRAPPTVQLLAVGLHDLEAQPLEVAADSSTRDLLAEQLRDWPTRRRTARGGSGSG